MSLKFPREADSKWDRFLAKIKRSSKAPCKFDHLWKAHRKQNVLPAFLQNDLSVLVYRYKALMRGPYLLSYPAQKVQKRERSLTWCLVIGTSRTMAMIVPLSMWGRVGRQHLCTRWIPLRFKRMELPGPERSGEVLGVTHGSEGQGPFQLPDAQDILGLGIIPCVYRRQIWSCSVPVGLGPLHSFLATA